MELSIEIRPKPGSFNELYQTLQELLPTIRQERGCLDCRIYRDAEDGETFFLSIHWKAQTSLEHYIRSSSGMAFLGAVALLSEKAGVKIGRDVPWLGIETLKKMKNKAIKAAP